MCHTNIEKKNALLYVVYFLRNAKIFTNAILTPREIQLDDWIYVKKCIVEKRNPKLESSMR